MLSAVCRQQSSSRCRPKAVAVTAAQRHAAAAAGQPLIAHMELENTSWAGQRAVPAAAAAGRRGLTNLAAVLV